MCFQIRISIKFNKKLSYLFIFSESKLIVRRYKYVEFAIQINPFYLHRRTATVI